MDKEQAIRLLVAEHGHGKITEDRELARAVWDASHAAAIEECAKHVLAKHPLWDGVADELRSLSRETKAAEQAKGEQG
jgi:hypothetical protein